MSERYDVVVVGAGLAGLQCARLLGERGLKVLLLDGKASLERSIHTTGIFVRRTFEDFELPEDCLGPPVRHVTLYSPARRPLDLSSERPEFRIGRMGPIYRHFLKACERAGAGWAPATRYAGCEPDGDSSLLRLESERRTRWVRARFVVGADGARSLVAQDLGLDVNRKWIVGVEEVLAGAATHGPPRLHCFLDPTIAPGYLAWVADDGEEIHVGVGGCPDRFDPLLALHRFRQSLAGVVDLRRAVLVERRGGRIPVGGILGRLANRRGLLVGDAAGAPSPMTAGGLDPCLRLSSLAALVIADHLEGRDPRALASYSGARFRGRFVSRLWMRRALAAVRSPATMEFACAMLRSPLLRPLAEHVFFGRGSFPEIEAAPRSRLQGALTRGET